MQIIRYAAPTGVHVGLWDGETTHRVEVPSIGDLLCMPQSSLRAALRSSTPEKAAVRLLPPIDSLTEVWAAGVTYLRSSQARQEESQQLDAYERVYTASRPELFFKSPAWRVVGHNEPVGIRDDSPVNVPEPELALVLNQHAEIIGATIGNDMSSRTIEGENPLYLPQAKLFAGSCALGPAITPVYAIPDVDALTISMVVRRQEQIAFTDHTSTANIARQYSDLVEHLFRAQDFPYGAVLATGTGIVPQLDFTLEHDDIVEITVEHLGTLRNTVRSTSQFGWLTPEPARTSGGD